MSTQVEDAEENYFYHCIENDWSEDRIEHQSLENRTAVGSCRIELQ